MGKMNDLTIEGVTDLHSYQVGVSDGRKAMHEETIQLIRNAIANPNIDIDNLPPRTALSIVVASMLWNQEEADDVESE